MSDPTPEEVVAAVSKLEVHIHDNEHRQFQVEKAQFEARQDCQPVEVRNSVISAEPGWYVVSMCLSEGDDGVTRNRAQAWPVAAWAVSYEPPRMWESKYYPDVEPLVNEGFGEPFDGIGQSIHNPRKTWVIHERQVSPEWLERILKDRDWSFEDYVDKLEAETRE